MRRTVLIPLLIVLAVLAIVGGIGYYIYDNYMYYQTDDAQVTGTIVSISAPTAGQLTSVTVKQGDRVTAGQTIAMLTPVANGNVNGTGNTPTPLNITSPIDGTIVQTPVVQGQSVSPGLTLMQLTNLDALTITSYIDEGAINNVSIGQTVDIRVDAYTDTTFSGHVQQVVQAAAGEFSLLPTQDNASGNFTKVGQRIPVVIKLDGNAGKDLVPGMSAETTIHLH